MVFVQLHCADTAILLMMSQPLTRSSPAQEAEEAQHEALICGMVNLKARMLLVTAKCVGV